MSTLTKVFVILVSLASIFLCGMVLVYIGSATNYKEAYEDQVGVAQASMVIAEATEMAKKRDLERFKLEIEKLQSANLSTLEWTAELQRTLSTETTARSEAENKVASALVLSESVQTSNAKLHEVERQLQTDLEAAFRAKTTAEAQVISLNQQLNQERAKAEQLDAIRRRQEEKIAQLENENTEIRQRLQTTTVSSQDFAKAEDRVALVSVGPDGVPIRGEIVAIDQDGLASLSVGSSSGVREGTRFQVVREGKYLGNVVVKMVEPRESAGRLENLRGEAVLVGDKVTTGFD